MKKRTKPLQRKKKNESRPVAKTARNLVLGAAARLARLERASNTLVVKARDTWKGTKPLRQKAKEKIKQTAKNMDTFQKEVRTGLREGVRDVRR